MLANIEHRATESALSYWPYCPDPGRIPDMRAGSGLELRSSIRSTEGTVGNGANTSRTCSGRVTGYLPVRCRRRACEHHSTVAGLTRSGLRAPCGPPRCPPSLPPPLVPHFLCKLMISSKCYLSFSNHLPDDQVFADNIR